MKALVNVQGFVKVYSVGCTKRKKRKGFVGCTLFISYFLSFIYFLRVYRDSDEKGLHGMQFAYF